MKEIKQLTPEQINEFCNLTINTLKNGSAVCLCYALKGYLESKDIYYSNYNEVSSFIPKFTNDNAVKYANGDKTSYNSNPWWNNGSMFYNYNPIYTSNKFDYDNRILFLEWLKEQYPITPEENSTPEEK